MVAPKPPGRLDDLKDVGLDRQTIFFLVDVSSNLGVAQGIRGYSWVADCKRGAKRKPERQPVWYVSAVRKERRYKHKQLEYPSHILRSLTSPIRIMATDRASVQVTAMNGTRRGTGKEGAAGSDKVQQEPRVAMSETGHEGRPPCAPHRCGASSRINPNSEYDGTLQENRCMSQARGERDHGSLTLAPSRLIAWFVFSVYGSGWGRPKTW